MTAVKKERAGLLVLRGHAEALGRVKSEGVAIRGWEGPDGGSTGFAASEADSMEAVDVVVVAVRWVLVDALRSVGLEEDAEVEATSGVAVAEKGRRSALRKAATPAFVLS